MARIRSIKPETWTDPAFVRCSPLARLLWIGSWNLADDQGVLKDEPERIRFAILPGDSVDAEALVEELVYERLLLRKRTTDGQAVLVIRTFREHQKIDTRREGRYGDRDELVDCGTLDEVLAEARPSAPTRASPRPNAPMRDHTIKDQGGDQGSLSQSATPTFGDFWALWPKKTRRKAAETLWDKSVAKTDPHEILEGLNRARDAWAQRETRYWPDPDKWLRGEQWNDEHPTEAPPPAPVADEHPGPVRIPLEDADQVAARDHEAAEHAVDPADHVRAIREQLRGGQPVEETVSL